MDRRTEDWPMFALASAAGVLLLLWAGAAVSALVCGHHAPPIAHLLSTLSAFAHFTEPSVAWHAPVGLWPVYWLMTTLVLGLAGLAAAALRHLFVILPTGPSTAGMAGRAEVLRSAAPRQLQCRAAILRPDLAAPTCTDIGYRIGRSRGVACWISVEDSIVVLGPPRSGKGLHMVIPAILEAPGAVITTSTRPDNVIATMRAREHVGPVAVFDPQGLSGFGSGAKWSPIQGCEVPGVALARARALCVDPGDGVENATFWAQQCLTAVRCLLHAAALDARTPAELYRWSLSPVAAQDAVDVLSTDARATTAWGNALEAVLSADPRQRDSTWSMVANVFAPLADPTVLDAVSPGAGEQFDAEMFLRSRGTVFLLGTASGASATANLISAFVDDVAETARRIAAGSPGARLNPPLAVVLDEAANYPLPSLPSLMSEGGGSGITTMVVLQSLAQARARWGADTAAAIWDAAIVKVVLGGSGSASDLRDLASLIGTREAPRVGESRGPDGRRSTSTSVRDVPILDTGELRTLPFGQAVLLLRAAPPILLDLQPWTARRGARPDGGHPVARSR